MYHRGPSGALYPGSPQLSAETVWCCPHKGKRFLSKLSRVIPISLAWAGLALWLFPCFDFLQFLTFPSAWFFGRVADPFQGTACASSWAVVVHAYTHHASYISFSTYARWGGEKIHTFKYCSHIWPELVIQNYLNSAYSLKSTLDLSIWLEYAMANCQMSTPILVLKIDSCLF